MFDKKGKLTYNLGFVSNYHTNMNIKDGLSRNITS